PAAAQAPGTLTIRLGLGTLPLRAGAPPSAVALVETAPRLPRFRQGDTIALTVANALTSPAVLNWRGLDGVPAAAPVAAIPPGGCPQPHSPSWSMRKPRPTWIGTRRC